MNYKISEIEKIIGAQSQGFANNDIAIEQIIFDSRKWFNPDASIFVAFQGSRQDGHNYISELYEKGVRNFIVSQTLDLSPFPDAYFLYVQNSLNALHQWANHHRNKYHNTMLAITGSNGKTIIKEWLFEILASEKQVYRSPLSYNSQIGVALSLLQLDPSNHISIIEAGISKTREMEKLETLIRPEIGIFSYLGEAHNAGFDSLEDKLIEKTKLFKNARQIIYCADQKIVHQHFTTNFQKSKLVSWSFDKSAEVIFKASVTYQSEGVEVELDQEGLMHLFFISFKDKASIHNAIHCYIAALTLGMEPIKIKQQIEYLQAVKMRLEIDAGARGCMLINDSYNADMDSFKNGLHVLCHQLRNDKKTVIISDFAETGVSKSDFLDQLSQSIISFNIYRIIAVGEALKGLSYLLPHHNIQYFKDTDTLFNSIDVLEFEKEDILIKGARVYHFERIYNYLSELAHQAVLEMDLDALRHNINVIGQYLKSKTKIMAVVKASAYGSGSKELARHLERCKIDYLSVAFIEEGVELRKAGVQMPILVLNPDNTGIDKLIQYQLEPEIYSTEQLHRFNSYIQKGQRFPIHLNIDSGMNRLGFKKEDIPEILDMVKASNFEIKSIFSHLAASGTKSIDTFTKEQINYFNDVYDLITSQINYKPMKHILNSNGIFRFPEYQYDLVRTGLALYGINGHKEVQKKLEKVHTFKARVSQIKSIKKGESIGYERSFFAQEDMKIATINLGYADGIPRLAGNEKYEVLVRGQKAMIIGNICMDMFMVDISHISNVQSQDEVIIFGALNPIEKLAEVSQTIPYEILSCISSRIKRIYIHSRV